MQTVVASEAANQSAANQSAAPLEDWIEKFHRDGFLVLHDVLPPELVQQLRDDLDRALDGPDSAGPPIVQRNQHLELRTRIFEVSRANLSLFDREPIVSFAEALIAPDCHVIHNNSFRTPPGSGISIWHQDDPPHLLVTHGEAPTNIRLPVLLFSANYYLSDATEVEHGPTEVVPGSHLFGAPCPRTLEGTKYQERAVSCSGKAGSVVMFNNQVWHRGAPNQSERTRYVTQVSYARRLIGHKYFPFMNYQMPEHVYAGADARLKRLLGFLPTGNYG